MKKISLLVSVLMIFIISNISYAQQFFPKFGFKGGMSNSTQNADFTNDSAEILYEQSVKYRAGYTFGVFADVLWYKYITVGTGLDFFQKGFKVELIEITEQGELGPAYIVINQNYLIWNAYAKISPPGLEPVHPYLVIAPRLDFFLGYKGYTSDFESFPNEEIDGEDYVLERYSKVSPSISFGAGVEIDRIIPYSILVEFMYVPDLFNQFDENGAKFKNTSFSISAGLKF